ncbi:MAG: hypothetical protein IJX72_03850 [Clostridia bacterium]|nr:hypothetical protein [Clostridia bacterium]
MKEAFDFEWNTDRVASLKVSYTHPQPEGLVAVREYKLTEVDGVRCLLLRWAKEADFAVDGFTFELEELDASGACIRRAAVTYGEADIPAVAKGETFIPLQGIPVSEPCTDIRVYLTALTSGRYRYSIQGNRVTVDYDAPEPWVYDGRGGREDGLSDRVSLRVVSSRRRKVKLIWPAAVLFVVLLLLVLLLPFVSDLIGPY